MRLFVAIDLPAEIKEQLGRLCAGVPGAKWVEQDNLHLTLRFIGEADGTQFNDTRQALAEVRGEVFELRLKGVGQFGQRRRVRQLWAGVEDSETLIRLQRGIEAALTGAGLTPERRKFHAHVTLARLKDTPIGRVGAYLADHGLFATESFAVGSFVLCSSVLSQSGPIYRAEATYPL